MRYSCNILLQHSSIPSYCYLGIFTYIASCNFSITFFLLLPIFLYLHIEFHTFLLCMFFSTTFCAKKLIFVRDIFFLLSFGRLMKPLLTSTIHGHPFIKVNELLCGGDIFHLHSCQTGSSITRHSKARPFCHSGNFLSNF